MDPETAEPLDTLAPLAKLAIKELGSDCTTVSDVIKSRDPIVFSAIAEGLERANEAAPSNAQKVCHRLNQSIEPSVCCIFLPFISTGAKVDTIKC